MTVCYYNTHKISTFVYLALLFAAILFDIEFLTLSVLESDPTATIVITPREPIPGPTPIELFVSTQDDSATGEILECALYSVHSYNTVNVLYYFC